MRIKLMNMPEIYVDVGENTPENFSKTAGVFKRNKMIYFSWDVHVKYIPNIIEVQSKSVKSDRHVKKPNSLASVYKSVLAK